jgi:hypothetical protein
LPCEDDSAVLLECSFAKKVAGDWLPVLLGGDVVSGASTNEPSTVEALGVIVLY